jgi:hypothetical protein
MTGGGDCGNTASASFLAKQTARTPRQLPGSPLPPHQPHHHAAVVVQATGRINRGIQLCVLPAARAAAARPVVWALHLPPPCIIYIAVIIFNRFNVTAKLPATGWCKGSSQDGIAACCCGPSSAEQQTCNSCRWP